MENGKKARRYYTDDEVIGFVKAHEASTQYTKEFERSLGLPYNVLTNWIKRLGLTYRKTPRGTKRNWDRIKNEVTR